MPAAGTRRRFQRRSSRSSGHPRIASHPSARTLVLLILRARMRRLHVAAHCISRTTPAEVGTGHAPVEEALRRPPRVKPTLPGTAASPWGYRQKAHFVFGNMAGTGRRRGALIMGHYARGSRRIVPVDECPVHDDRGNRAAFGFFDGFARRESRRRRPEPGAPTARQARCGSIAVRVASKSPR
jgi:hypothetical protein